MIYTIGNEQSYLRAIAYHESGVIQKTGYYAPGEHPHFPHGYSGGLVFETYEAAQQYVAQHALPSYCVWGLDAEWATDTTPIEGYPHVRRLLKHSNVLPLHHLQGNALIDGYHIVTAGHDALCGHPWDMVATMVPKIGVTDCAECNARWLAQLRKQFVSLRPWTTPEAEIGIVRTNDPQFIYGIPVVDAPSSLAPGYDPSQPLLRVDPDGWGQELTNDGDARRD